MGIPISERITHTHTKNHKMRNPCIFAAMLTLMFLRRACSQPNQKKLVPCKSKDQRDFAMAYCSYKGLCVEYENHPEENKQCLCYEDWTGHNCEIYNPKNTRINFSELSAFLEIFKNQDNKVTSDRFLFIAIMIFSNTIIMLFGIFVSYQKTKRHLPWTYNRTEESMTL